MPTIITDPGALITEFPAALPIEVTNNFNSPFETVHFVYCDKLTLALNAYDTAELSYEIGDVMQQGTNFFTDYQPLNLTGKFVRVTIPQEAPLTDIVWYGYILGSVYQRSATRGEGAAEKLTGRKQVFTAVGLEYFLDRRQIDSSIIQNTGGMPDYVRIQRPMTFNGGKSNHLDNSTATRGNRHPTTNSDSLYAFSDRAATPSEWTAFQIAEHLLAYHGPVDSTNAPSPTEYIMDPGDAIVGVLDGLTPKLPTEGLTVFQSLNALCDTKRGLCWWLEFSYTAPGNHHARIRTATTATANITLPSGGSLPANESQQTLDFDGERSVQDVAVKSAGSRAYDQIIVRGSRMTSTLTLGMADDTLEADWTSANATAYESAASGTTGYGSLTETEQEKRNDAFRRSEAFYRVFNAFRIPADWDGKSGDGDDSMIHNWAIPNLSPTGSILGGLPIIPQGVRLLNHTRLKRGWSYADADNPTSTSPTGSDPEYMPPFAIVQVATSPSKYQFIDKMRDTDFAEGTPVSDDIGTSYHLIMQQTVPGIRLRPVGSLNHAFAKNHYLPTEPSAVETEVDYDTLRLTVTAEADAYCEAVWPIVKPTGKPLQTLTIYAGEEYRLDYLAANTVVDLNNGEPVLADTGAVLRDDRTKLQDIARLAYEWYSIDRVPLTVNFKHIRNLFELGMLITTIGDGTAQETVNTVVSMITYDLLKGETVIETHDDDLDVGVLV